MESRIRRTRKRRRIGLPPTQQSHVSEHATDDAPVFSENNFPPRDTSAELAVQNALPTLLNQRQCGLITRSSMMSWQRRVLRCPQQYTRWRKYCVRHISFLEMRFPYFEAVLAIDPSGSYMLTMCDKGRENDDTTEEKRPTAFLRIRGVPSPARLQTGHKKNYCPTSDTLLTIPVDFATEGVAGRFAFQRRILCSFVKDWRMALFLGPLSNTPRDRAAHIFVFPLPRLLKSSDDIVSIFRTVDIVSIPQVFGSMNGNNLLWEVEFVPRPTDWGRLKEDGYLCVLNLLPEMRLTWFTMHDRMDNIRETSAAQHMQGSVHHSLRDILSVSSTSFWQRARSDRITGALALASDDSFILQDQLHIACEATVNVDRLVRHILQRRPKLSNRYKDSEEYRLQWKCEVIDVLHGRLLNLLIVLSPGKGKTPVAVAVSLDTAMQSYIEVEWRKTKTPFARIDMRDLCTSFRMRHVHREQFSDYDESFEPEEGDDGVHYTGPNREDCFVPLSALYPDCQVVSNLNILHGVPRMKLSSQSPVQLVYDPYE